MWSYILIGIAVIIFILFFFRLSQKGKDKDVGPFPLETKPQIASVDDAQTLLNKTNTGSFQVFVFPNPLKKTGQITKCTESGLTAPADPGLPDCATGKYPICPCKGTDCSPCRHIGYVNVLNISNTIRIELLAAPDASRQKAASTQLIVRTVGTRLPKTEPGSNIVPSPVQTSFEEPIVLPNLPFQKWTMITITREGRRFDIYYNDKLVMSKRTQYQLDGRLAFSSIVAGDPDLNGQVALVETFPTKLSLTDVIANYKAKATTTGEPILPQQLNVDAALPLCKDGNCIRGPAVKPPSPLMDWELKYE